MLWLVCDLYGFDYYDRFKVWVDEYFFILYCGCVWGVGGIFYDDLNIGDWQVDFVFIYVVGEVFLFVFLFLVCCCMDQLWIDVDCEVQLIYCGFYVEYNFVYDWGIKFGLVIGYDVEVVLMSLLSLVKWV